MEGKKGWRRLKFYNPVEPHKVKMGKLTTVWGRIQVEIRLEVYVSESPTYRCLVG